MEISVIVTNYNYEAYIGRCLRSLVSQSISKRDYEIICVDDSSTDSSQTIISTFGEEVNAIFLKENVGLASAANIGLRAAKGRLIVRVDSDDYVHPDFLRVLLLSNELFGADFEAFALDYTEVDEFGNHQKHVSSNDFPIACAIAFKMEALRLIGAYKEGLRIFEERELMKRFQSSGLRLCNINLPLYRYVQHGESLSRGGIFR
jgi:glycosyltransferase involved in cell wall biosynthesis